MEEEDDMTKMHCMAFLKNYYGYFLRAQREQLPKTQTTIAYPTKEK